MVTVSRVHGTFFDSCDRAREMIVATATMKANGIVKANPYASRCGFMSPSHVQTSTPIWGRHRMNGSNPKTTPVTTMSLIEPSPRTYMPRPLG